jgi:eukaryotic-like serine/threonine-protein kinase
MALTDSFVLPAGAVLAPVSELPERLRREIGSQDGDYTLSRSNSRAPSKLIDADAAALLREFQQPNTIARAVARFSKAKRIDAERLLEEALPMLQSLIEAGFLVPSFSKEASQLAPSLAAEQRVDGWTVLRCVQALDDTEIHAARGPDGTLGALKICRSAFDSAGPAIVREAAILAELDSTVTPRLLKSGDWNARPYLLTEWFSGADAETVCAEFRRRGDEQARKDLLALTGAVLRAYADLHAQGVIHGDVHPRNLLIDRQRVVKIIDLGFARKTTEGQPSDGLARAGVSFFLEPEFAEAARRSEPPPPATFGGEQYSLAALLYLLLTGAHYLDFVFEKDAMLRQIAEARMVPFARHGIASWPDVERLLEKALSKAPTDRFSSVADFAQAWEAADIPRPASEITHAGDSKLLVIYHNVLGQCAIGGPLMQDGALEAPAVSVNYGGAGLACALYRIACASDDAELLAAADCWSTRAVQEIGNAGAFYDDDLEITRESVGSVSLYHGPAGVYAVQALIAQARGDAVTQSAATQAFIEISRQPCEVLDLTLGRAGALLGCALLLATFDDASLRGAGNDLLKELSQTLEAYPPITEPRGLSSALGIAHGWAGLLYAALCWSITAGEPLPAPLSCRLHELAACAHRVGRGLQWNSYMPGWCNGSAGFVFLWTQAYRATGEQTYLELAEGAAWNAWAMVTPNASLCCGTTGLAYALLNFYRYSGDPTWLRRARDCAQSAAFAPQYERPERPTSLYKGAAGLAVLCADLERPEQARMPMFECEP